MITLLIVGPAVEVMLGKVRFLTLYLLAGIGGNVALVPYLAGQRAQRRRLRRHLRGPGRLCVLALIRHKPMGPVVALIVINLVIGFTGNIEWQAHVGGL